MKGLLGGMPGLVGRSHSQIEHLVVIAGKKDPGILVFPFVHGQLTGAFGIDQHFCGIPVGFYLPCPADLRLADRDGIYRRFGRCQKQNAEDQGDQSAKCPEGNEYTAEFNFALSLHILLFLSPKTPGCVCMSGVSS